MSSSIKGRTPSILPPSPPSSESDDGHVHRAPESQGQEDHLSEGLVPHEGGPSAPLVSGPAPRKPSSRAGSVNMHAPGAKHDSVARASAEIIGTRATASGQILTLRYSPEGRGGQNSSVLYEVALPRGATGEIADADYSSLADSLAKLIQTAEDHSTKKGKPLTSFTFTKPSHHGAPPSLILVLDKGEQKDTVDLSQEKDFQPPFLDSSLHTELNDLFAHLHACLHLQIEDRVHAKITRLDDDTATDEKTR